MEKTQRVEVKALDKKVLTVAKEGFVDDWTAYIGAVPGKNHELEFNQVLAHGSKLSREVAEVLFPDFVKAKLTWRY